ncbi:MAG: DinB family protein [Bacteroidetes bacterium]|nr:DinB family protein [Bacteroidota bacterium]MBS1608220.1 DinB family protein [Bacteroidota bacterium]
MKEDMLQNAINNVFLQLTSSLEQLDDKLYSMECAILSNATIGKHLRHVIELFQSLEKGYERGIVNYDKRKRDNRIETDKEFALMLLNEIRIGLQKPDKDLVLESSYDEDSSELISIKTNYNRELAYNLEHTIHHMALIRVGINAVSDIQLPENYGVASSTVRHRQICAQ